MTGGELDGETISSRFNEETSHIQAEVVISVPSAKKTRYGSADVVPRQAPPFQSNIGANHCPRQSRITNTSF